MKYFLIILMSASFLAPSLTYAYGSKPNLQERRKSLFDWKGLDQESWLDFQSWKRSRELKDKEPGWRNLVRDRRHREYLGEVIKCVGQCFRFRGITPVKASSMSQIIEGDEIELGPNSYAWIYLVNGGLVRISPSTSIAFNEVNIGQESLFIAGRLNYGHIYYSGRSSKKFKTLNKAESDLIMYPLYIHKANRTKFSIEEYRLLNDHEKTLYSLAQNKGHISQYIKLNSVLDENTKAIHPREQKILFYTANGSFISQGENFSLAHQINGKTFIKNLSADEESLLSILGRGYNNKKEESFEGRGWYSYFENELMSESINNPGIRTLEMALKFTKRIPTIQLARELLFQKKSKILFEKKLNPKIAAEKYGYHLWDNGLNNRVSFLIEYIRRVETTFLASSKKIKAKSVAFDRGLYDKAMRMYYDKLTKTNSDSSNEILSFNDSQYYLWVLKNEKND